MMIRIFILLIIAMLSSCSSLSKRIVVIEENFINTVNKINDQKIEAVSGLSKRKHYRRNLRQPVIPKTENEILAQKNWQEYWIQDGISPTHNLMNVKGNTSYRGLKNNSHIQVVYDKYGRLVTSDENMGSYDFGVVYKNGRKIDQEGLVRHFRKDVYPWIYWGNTAEDKTSKQERLNAVLESVKGSKTKINILDDLI